MNEARTVGVASWFLRLALAALLAAISGESERTSERADRT